MTTVQNKSVNPDVDAIRHHYEVSNDFYRLLLGPAMMYSGGYWAEGEDLREGHETAQYRKLDAVIQHAGALGGPPHGRALRRGVLRQRARALRAVLAAAEGARAAAAEGLVEIIELRNEDKIFNNFRIVLSRNA